MGDLLNGMGRAYYYLADLKQAEPYFMRALTLAEKWTPGSMNVAVVLHNLGLIALDRRNLNVAQNS